MKNQIPASFRRKSVPVLAAALIGLTACSGDQAGDTNGGLVGGIGGVSGTTALGVVGGIALAGVLLSDGDDNSTAVGGTGAGDDTGTGGTGTGGTGTDGTGTDGTGTDGTGTDGTGTDGTGTGGTGTGGTGTGGTGTDGTGTDGTGTGGTGTDGTGTDGSGTGGTGTGGTGTGGTGTGGTGAGLTSTGSFQEQLVASESVPATTATGIGTSNLVLNRTTGEVSGTVALTGVTADRVDLMAGPPGSNGFPAVSFEDQGGGVWTVPQTLSAAQIAFVLQNLNSGNLYLAARDETSAGSGVFADVVRVQVMPNEVVQYTTSIAGADGFLLVNPSTGDYSITWNTSDSSLVSAHVNDGDVDGATENNYAPLTQRASNPARFFLDGNFNNAADPLYPDLLDRLDNGTVWLDAHTSDDTRVFFGQLNAI